MWYSEKLQGYVIHNLFSIICVDTTCGNYVRELLSKIRIKSILFLKGRTFLPGVNSQVRAGLNY